MTAGMSKVLVIGATGRVGREVVSQLLANGSEVRAFVRPSSDTRRLPPVELAVGDLTQPETLDRALDGVDAAFLVWTAPPSAAPRAIEHLRRGVRRLVLLSSPHQTPHPFFQQPNPMAELHRELERLVAAAGFDLTTLRPGMFASNTVMWWADQIRKGDEVRWPYAAAETAPIDEQDIAAVAVRAFDDPRHVGHDYVLTGPRGITHAAQLAVIGAAIDRRPRYVESSPDEFREQMRGVPNHVVDMLLNAWDAAAKHPAYVSTVFETITGRPPRSFEEWAHDHAESFQVGSA